MGDQTEGIEEAYRDRNILALSYVRQAHQKEKICEFLPGTEFNGDYGYREAPNCDDEWVVLWCETREGQVSWHIPRTLVEDLDWLPQKDKEWDGHTREEKNHRLMMINEQPSYEG